MRAVAAHWGELPPREQKILIMRFTDDMTQAQIGQQLGISQMHVSRLTARALGQPAPARPGAAYGAAPGPALPRQRTPGILGHPYMTARPAGAARKETWQLL